MPLDPKQISAADADSQSGTCLPANRKAAAMELLPAGGLLSLTLLLLAVAYLQAVPVGGRYLVIAPPGWSLAQTINLARSADGRMVRPGRFPNMLFVASLHPDYGSALISAGAWLVLPSPARWDCTDTADRMDRP